MQSCINFGESLFFGSLILAFEELIKIQLHTKIKVTAMSYRVLFRPCPKLIFYQYENNATKYFITTSPTETIRN